ncbi:unnamed protein product [Staurois parvus]|uniref:PiggyBac transposable element-derived protein domain-containing protein n=1 Tax=Staurois parvus TaxID=386267 RepID=A0ABN9H2F7_9NEOB|nr:unnamed protein product [Staurois parvus]
MPALQYHLVKWGDISAVQAGAVVGTSSVPQPPRICTQARRAPSILPDVLANPDWQPTNSAAPVLSPFTVKPGIQVETANLNTPLDFLERFVKEDLYALIVDQNNLYAQQFIAANSHSNLTRPFAWKPITVSECKVFLCLTLNMGITKKKKKELVHRPDSSYASVLCCHGQA